MKVLRFVGRAAGWLVLSLALLWAFGALWYDFPVAWLRRPLAVIAILGAVAALILVRPRWRTQLWVTAGLVVILGWWLTQRPTNVADWQPDVAQLPWAEVNGDVVTLHNVRNCDYRTETDYTPRWETRTVRLSQLTGIDLAIDYWGSPWIAHPIASFQFTDADPVCFSIETRKKVGQTYSAIAGFYRQFELIYIASVERDVIRLRTNYRREQIYLYRTTSTPAQARERFMEYIRSINQLRERPAWYNAITTNCTTSIRDQHPSAQRTPWDWRILLNGKGDELMYERRSIVTDGLPFAELKQRALIDQAAQAANDSLDFSTLIRANRPGFTAPTSAAARP